MRFLVPGILLSIVAPASAADPTPAELAAELLSDLSLHHDLELLDKGSAPYAVVKYAPKPGAVATCELRTKNQVDLTLPGPDGTPMAIPLGGLAPTTVVTLRHTVGQPVANGLVPVRMAQIDHRVEDAPPEVAAAVEASLAAMKGLAFDLLIDPATGRTVQLDVVGAAPGADPAMADLLQGMADQLVRQMPTFPDQAIGRGARWTVDSDIRMSGLNLQLTQTTTVTEITPTAVSMDVAMSLRAPDGPLALPGIPPGAAVDLSRFSGSGKGATKVDLGTFASSGTLRMDIDLGMKVAVPGQPPMEMQMKLAQTTEMRTK